MFGNDRFIKTIFIAFINICCINIALTQALEIDGTAKVNDLQNDNTAESLVVVLDDGSFGTRDVSSLNTGSGSSVQFIVGGGSAFNGSYTDDNFIPMGSSVRTAAYNDAKTRVPLAGTLTNFEGAITTTTSATNYVFTVYKNGSPTNLTCTVNQGSTSCTDLSNCISLVAGDFISIRYKGNSGSGTSDNRPGRWVAIFTPGGTCP